MQPAIFLDRDGVIIENKDNYVQTWEDVEIFPQSLEALNRVSQSGYKVVIITNQSGIGRGIIPWNEADRINQRLVQVIKLAGGRVDGIFVCPHKPDEGCECRKPKPGLFYQAAATLSLDLSRSVMVGDAITDLEAAHAAGVRILALVLTGRGGDQIGLARDFLDFEFFVFDTLKDALEALI